MKTLTRAGAMGAFGLAAFGAALPAMAKGSGSGEAEKLVGQFVEIVNGGAPDRLSEVFGPVYKQHQEGVGDGVAAAINFFKTSVPPGIKLEVVRTIVEKDYVAAIFRVTGTVQGKAIDQMNVDVWRVENGKFVEHWA